MNFGVLVSWHMITRSVNENNNIDMGGYENNKESLG